jgi:hypothetical protein
MLGRGFMSWPFPFMPVFTNVLEGEFHEVHIPDTECQAPKFSRRRENVPTSVLKTTHLATAMDRCALRCSYVRQCQKCQKGV